MMNLFKAKLYWQIVFGMVAGALFGAILPGQVAYVDWMGTVFLRLLKMVVVPLVFTSLVTGISQISSGEGLKRIGVKTMIYYLSTSLVAILTGLAFVNLIRPGAENTVALPSSLNFNLSPRPITDTLLEIVPENIIQALARADMLSIIFMAIVFGYFIRLLPEGHSKRLTGLFAALFELVMKITVFIIKLAPIGIFGIIAGVTASQGDAWALLLKLGSFVMTFFAGLSVHFFITLPLVLYLFFKINPLQHLKAMLAPLLTAFSTASSNATLPVTMEHIEIKSGVSSRISGFTLPLGATINMDGTALYELVVAVFVAQLYGIELTFAQQFIIVFTALLASIGTAGIPMASFATMSIIFTAVGLPLEAIALILPVDRPLDMCRTATNVWSDTCGAVIIAKTEGEKLAY